MMKLKNLKWSLVLVTFIFSGFAGAESLWRWKTGGLNGFGWEKLPMDQELAWSFFRPWATIVGPYTAYFSENNSTYYYPGQTFKLDKRDGHVIWEYTGAPKNVIFNDNTTPTVPNPSNIPQHDWKPVDSNPQTVKIVSENGKLYQLHNNGRIFAYKNQQWNKIDDNYRTKNIVIASGALYQIHSDGKIWAYDESCNREYLPPGRNCWLRIDSNRASHDIKEHDGDLIQLHL